MSVIMGRVITSYSIHYTKLYEVHTVGRSVGSHDDDHAQWHALDLFDHGDTAELVTRLRPTHLLHLAWNTEHGRFWLV